MAQPALLDRPPPPAPRPPTAPRPAGPVARRLVPAPVAAAPPDFARLVGAAGWRRLAAPIRHRFAEHPTAARPIRYEGIMHRVGGNAAGALLATLCRLLGTPFAPYRGTDVPVAITLRPAPGGVTWQRDYHYPGRPPATVRSTKRATAEGGLLESIGCGLGLRLAVFEADQALHFLSLAYVWRRGRRWRRLPSWLTPGTLHVVHEELGAGRFRFAMTLHHPLFGRLFDQEGVFTRAREAAFLPLETLP